MNLIPDFEHRNHCDDTSWPDRGLYARINDWLLKNAGVVIGASALVTVACAVLA